MVFSFSRMKFSLISLVLFSLSIGTQTKLLKSKYSQPNHITVKNDKIPLLRVGTAHYEPFMYQNHDGKFYNGIEYKLIQTIAEQLGMELLMQNSLERFSDYDQPTSRYLI